MNVCAISRQIKKYLPLLEKNIMPGITTTIILKEFETCTITAFAEEFPLSKHHGYFFHFSRCILQKIKSAGLRNQYETDVLH